MHVIRELEPGPRGVYCGAIGVVAPPSAPFRARFSVAIRTAVVDRTSGTAEYGVGGAITWGSDAVRERAELLAEAAVLTHDIKLSSARAHVRSGARHEWPRRA